MELKLALSLVSKLASPVFEVQKHAVCEIRLLAKQGTEDRAAIARAGAVPLLLKLLSSPNSKMQENAVTALLNLSICPSNKGIIMQPPESLDFIMLALSAGKTAETKENAAALLFSLMVAEDNRLVIGQKPGLIQALLDLVRSGSPRGVKDALKALFHVALCADNRPILVAAGGIPVLLSLLFNGKSGLVEDSLAVLAQTVGCPESIEPCRKSSAIPTLIDFLDTGSPRAQENAASALLNHCRSGGEEIVSDVLESGTCLPLLQRILSTGTNRGKAKASALLQLLIIG